MTNMNNTTWYRLIAVVVFFFIGEVAGAGASGHELFVQANEWYKQGSFEKAYHGYQGITDKSVQVHYNLGNCAYKMGHLGEALLHWRRAERDWGLFNRDELLSNIMLVKKQLSLSKKKHLVGQDSPVSMVIRNMKKLQQSVVSVIRSLSLLYLQLFFLIAWGLLFFFMRFCRKRDYRGVIVVLFVFVAISGSMLAMKYGMSYRQYAVVTAKDARVYSGPGTTYQHLGSLREGQEGVIKKQSGDFYKVCIDRFFGWVSAKDVGRV